jgi:hypothetical protein
LTGPWTGPWIPRKILVKNLDRLDATLDWTLDRHWIHVDRPWIALRTGGPPPALTRARFPEPSFGLRPEASGVLPSSTPGRTPTPWLWERLARGAVHTARLLIGPGGSAGWWLGPPGPGSCRGLVAGLA